MIVYIFSFALSTGIINILGRVVELQETFYPLSTLHILISTLWYVMFPCISVALIVSYCVKGQYSEILFLSFLSIAYATIMKCGDIWHQGKRQS